MKSTSLLQERRNAFGSYKKISPTLTLPPPLNASMLSAQATYCPTPPARNASKLTGQATHPLLHAAQPSLLNNQ